MTPLAFAWRSLTRRPARAALGIAGVAVVGALLFDMLLLSRGLQVSFRDLLDSVGFDVRITATDALPGTGPLVPDGAGVVQRLPGLAEIEEAVGFRFGQAEAPDHPDDEFSIQLIGATGRARETWKVVAGEDLRFDDSTTVPAVLLNRRLADALRAVPGQTVRLRGACRSGTSALPPAQFRVAGIVEFRFDARSGITALMTLEEFARTCDYSVPGNLDLILVRSAPGVASSRGVEAVKRAHPDLHVFSNRQLVDRLEVSNFSYFRQVSFALSTVTVFFAFLLTTTLLTVSVNQRLGEVAGLRALGFARRRIAADLICESAILVGTGGLLSLPLGGLLAVQLDAILREMPGLPERLHFFVFQPRALLLHAVLLGTTGLLASLYPVYLAARLPIAATLRKEIVS